MSKSTFEKAFEEAVAVEGGTAITHLTPAATRYGITEARARENGYEGDMRLLPLRRARSIYLEDYWRPLHLSTIEEIADEVGYTETSSFRNAFRKHVGLSASAYRRKHASITPIAAAGRAA